MYNKCILYKGLIFMDCLTISTYRNLEQQAIRQYKEAKLRETSKSFYMETFRQENAEIGKANCLEKPDESNKTSLGNRILNYFA